MSARIPFVLLVCASSACHTPPPRLPLTTWDATAEATHPLVGKIYDARAGALVDVAELRERVRTSRFILVGEKHDNPDHHRVQAAVIAALIGSGSRPALVAEMINTDQQAVVDRVLAAGGADADDLAAGLAWDASGWPAFEMYSPVFDVAIGAGLPVFGGNLSHPEAKALSRAEEVTLPPAQRDLLAEPLAEPVRARLDEMLAAGHCNHAPPAMLVAMARVQRARDARFAATLAEQGAERGGVLIAGLEHVRRDYGVPWYLERLLPGAVTTVVAAVEVAPGEVEPSVYLRDAGEPIFDLIYFTPRVDTEDPCERFREKLEKMQAKTAEPQAEGS